MKEYAKFMLWLQKFHLNSHFPADECCFVFLSSLTNTKRCAMSVPARFLMESLLSPKYSMQRILVRAACSSFRFGFIGEIYWAMPKATKYSIYYFFRSRWQNTVKWCETARYGKHVNILECVHKNIDAVCESHSATRWSLIQKKR